MLIMVVLEKEDDDEDDEINTSKLHKDILWNSSVSVYLGLSFLDGCFLSYPAGTAFEQISQF